MVISLVNQKGGTGKTTSTVNLGSALASLNKKVLLLDLDPQGSLSFSFGIHQPKLSISQLLTKKATLPKVVLHKENLDIVPAELSLADVEISLAGLQKREFFLQNVVKKATEYDYILIDCPPSLSLLTVNALNASEHIIIPMQMEVLSLKGLEYIISTVGKVNKAFSKNIDVMGVLPVMVDIRKNLNDEVRQYIHRHFEVNIFSSAIRTNVKASEAPSFGKSVLSYAPSSNSAQDYRALAKEIIQLNYN